MPSRIDFSKAFALFLVRMCVKMTTFSIFIRKQGQNQGRYVCISHAYMEVVVYAKY